MKLKKKERKNKVTKKILLPKKNDGLKEMENTLTIEQLNQTLIQLQGISEQKVELIFPRYKIEASFKLSSVLSELGIKSAFSSQANFSGIATNPPPEYISQVIHKAFVEVNEKGAEAAAFTAMAMLGASLAVEKPLIFRADHPFLFLLIDSQTRTILFIGNLVNPNL
jgi:serpin B